jgi:hypothetical protein
MIGNFLAVLNFNRSFLKLNRFACNLLSVLPDHRSQALIRAAMSISGLTHLVFWFEVFNALQTQFGPSKYTSLKTTLQNETPIENEDVT